MRRNLNDTVLLQENVFSQHAVYAAAERRGVHIGRRLAAMPALKEIAGDPVAPLHAPNPGTNFDHLTGPVR